MAYEDVFRMSVHAVISDLDGRVLLLRATYGSGAWGLPGGALEPGETVLDALTRECREELGAEIKIRYLSGIYYHTSHNSHVLIFRCSIPRGAPIQLSPEHNDWRYFDVEELSSVQRCRVEDCLGFSGMLHSRRF